MNHVVSVVYTINKESNVVAILNVYFVMLTKLCRCFDSDIVRQANFSLYVLDLHIENNIKNYNKSSDARNRKRDRFIDFITYCKH